MNLLVPGTQGINYLGSKLKLLPSILDIFEDLNVKTVLDGFSGTTRVSQALAKTGYQVISNDISEWSYIFGLCYLKNKKQPEEYIELIDHLNSIKGYDGWFTEHYGGENYMGKAVQSDGTKKPWQMHNARKLDGIRDEIDRLGLPEVDRAVVLTSLILALDSVSSTFCHFMSYRRNWAEQSYLDLKLQVPNVIVNEREHSVIKGDIFDTIKDISVDVAYFDPPYGTDNNFSTAGVLYAGSYHIWSTICKNDKPKVVGVTHRREDSLIKHALSAFENYKKDENGRYVVVDVFDQLIRDVDARYVALSYNSEGRISIEEVKSIMEKYGKVISLTDIKHRKCPMPCSVKIDKMVSPEEVVPYKEYIILMEKQK